MTSLVAQVNATPGRSTLDWNGSAHPVTFHLFVNKSADAIDVMWASEKHETLHGRVAAGSNLYAGELFVSHSLTAPY